MSSFNPLLAVQEEALRNTIQDKEVFAQRKGMDAYRSATTAANKLEILNDMWRESLRETKGDQTLAKELYKQKAKEMRIEDPFAEARILREATTTASQKGVFDLVGGKLPPEQEQAVRTGQPWAPSIEMVTDQQLHEAKLTPGKRDDMLESIKQEQEEYKQKTNYGSPTKAGDVWEFITRPFQLGGQAVAGGIARGLGHIRKEQQDYREEHPWLEQIGGIGPTVAGVDVGQFLLLDRPDVSDQLSEVGKGAIENAESNGRSAESSIPGYLTGVIRDYIKQHGEGAIEQAQSELGAKADPDKVQDRAIEIVLEKVPESDLSKLAMEHPYLTDFIIQTGGDPINAAPLLRAALKPVLKSSANKLGRLGELIGDVGSKKTGRTLGNAFNADYDIDKLIRRGYETEGAQLSVVEPKARYLVQSSISDLREKYLRPISKLVKSPEDKKLFFDALHGDPYAYSMVKAKPELRQALEYHMQLEKEHAALRGETAQGQYWSDEGVLMNPAELQDQHYVPHRITQTPAYTPEQWKLTKGRNLNQNKAGSSFSRDAESDVSYVPDVVKQWEAEFKEFARPAQGSQQIKETARIATEGGLMKTVQLDKIDEEATALTQSTGMKWLPLEDAVDDVWQKYSGTPLHLKKGTMRTLVPEPMVNQVRMLTTFSDPKDPNKFVKFVTDAVGFSNRFFSKAMTVPWVKFHEVQAVSNLGLAPVFFGADVFSNRMAGSIPAAIGSAAKNPTLLKNLPVVFKNGTKSNWYDVVQLARERGVVSPTNLLDMDVLADTTRQTSTGFGAAIANAPSAVEKGLRKVGEVTKLPDYMARAAKVSDDQVKLMAFANFLEGTSPVAADIAAKKAGEFAMNYGKLGWLEKEVISNVIPFYGWQKFIAPRIIKTAITHPERIAPFIKAYESSERRYGPNAPYTEKGVPSYLEGRAVTAPYSLQPPDQQEKIAEGILDLYDKKGKPEPGSDEFTMLTLETGPAMAIPVLVSMFGDDRNKSKQMLFPVFNAMMEMAMGEASDTGDPLTRFPTNSDQWGASPYGRFVKNSVGRFSDSASRILALLKDDPKAQANFRLRLQVANDIGYFGTQLWNAVDEDANIPEVPFGMRANYVESPVKNAEYEKANILEDIQGFSRSERRGNR